MNEQIICNKEDLVAIADAVRASNGSTETYNVPELSVAAVEAIGSGTGGGVQPNWDAGENELGHILNRTHYTETVEGVILNNAYSDTTMEGMFVIAQPLASNLTLGSSYQVIYNGTSYNCVCSEVELFGVKGLGLGNTQYMGGPLQTDHPFSFVAIPDDMVESFGVYGGVLALDGASNVTISILGVSEVIHKIDNKYINFPNSFLRNGSSIGSLRGTFTATEDEEYKMGQQSFAVGYGTKASNYDAFASGCDTEASGWSSHAEGWETKASGKSSHAEGKNTEALGDYSHAEGEKTIASGPQSHAEGSDTIASGTASHTEGDVTSAVGYASHAEGFYTKASGNYSHAQGKYNIEDTQHKYAHIVGNGGYNEPSNAHTLDWDGNAWFAGDVYVGGESQDDGNKLLTQGNVSWMDVAATNEDRPHIFIQRAEDELDDPVDMYMYKISDIVDIPENLSQTVNYTLSVKNHINNNDIALDSRLEALDVIANEQRTIMVANQVIALVTENNAQMQLEFQGISLDITVPEAGVYAFYVDYNKKYSIYLSKFQCGDIIGSWDGSTKITKQIPDNYIPNTIARKEELSWKNVAKQERVKTSLFSLFGIQIYWVKMAELEEIAEAIEEVSVESTTITSNQEISIKTIEDPHQELVTEYIAFIDPGVVASHMPSSAIDLYGTTVIFPERGLYFPYRFYEENGNTEYVSRLSIDDMEILWDGKTEFIQKIPQEYLPSIPNELPAFSEDDNGKILAIVGGKPTWVSIPNAEEASF